MKTKKTDDYQNASCGKENFMYRFVLKGPRKPAGIFYGRSLHHVMKVILHHSGAKHKKIKAQII